MGTSDFTLLIKFLASIPGIKEPVLHGIYVHKKWWVKITIDIDAPLAWNIVQELGHILNYISLDERLPTIFYPVSPPPYMNGGPRDFLSWIIENTDGDFMPNDAKEWLEGRMPNPVNNPQSWVE